MADLGDVLLIKQFTAVAVKLSGSFNLGEARIYVYNNNVVITSGTVSGNTYLKRKTYLILDDSSLRLYQSAYTNESTGAVTFYNVPPGKYKLIIEGNKYPDDPGASFASQVFDGIVVV